MEDQQKPTPKSEKVFSFLSQDEVEKLRQEEERKIASLGKDRVHQRFGDEEDEDDDNRSDGGDRPPGDKSDINDNNMREESATGRTEEDEQGRVAGGLLTAASPLAKTPISRIPIRTVNAEKRARASNCLPPEYDESKLSPSEIRALRAQKRAAWRQARLKSLENDALQAQIMIQTMAAGLGLHEDSLLNSSSASEGVDGSFSRSALAASNVSPLPAAQSPLPTPPAPSADNNDEHEVETMREKIIMFELEDSSSADSERDGGGKVEAKNGMPTDQADGTGRWLEGSEPAVHQPDQPVQLQTIVEVINPMLSGDGQPNDIAIGRYSDVAYGEEDSLVVDGVEDATDATTPVEYAGRYAYEHGAYESINDKMKHVLRELKQNEKVRQNLSKSLTEEEILALQAQELAEQEEDGLEEEEEEEEDVREQYEEKTGAIGTVFMVRERLINDFYTHQTELAQEQQQQQRKYHQQKLMDDP
uniref:Scribbled n=1 Tax=Anopheles coluzzii TaxID=1518534 RepID=A0A8W7PVD7_ANOCL